MWQNASSEVGGSKKGVVVEPEKVGREEKQRRRGCGMRGQSDEIERGNGKGNIYIFVRFLGGNNDVGVGPPGSDFSLDGSD